MNHDQRRRSTAVENRAADLMAVDGLPWDVAVRQAEAEHPDTETVNDEIDENGQDREEATRQPKLWTLTDMVKPRPIQWLAHNRIPRGAVTVLVGDEGIGKSLLWVWLAARITTGRPAPEFGVPAGAPGHVVLFLAENGLADMDRPRMEAAGVDPEYVHVYCVEADGSGTPPLDLFAVADILAADFTPALIVADPWLDMVPSNLSVKDGQQAKRALRPWRELAVKTNAGVLLVCHTNRTDSANARDKYGATAELRKTARMTLFAQVDDETEHLTIGPEKSNVAARGIPASQFTITAESMRGFTDGVPVLTFAGESAKTATDIIADKWEASRPDADDRTDVQIWLEDYLTTTGPVSRPNVMKAAKAAGFTVEKTIQRTFKRLNGVAEHQTTEKGKVAFWSLPGGGDTSTAPDPISLGGVPMSQPPTEQGKQVSLPPRVKGVGTRQKHRVPTVPTAATQPHLTAVTSPTEPVRAAILDALDDTGTHGASPGALMRTVREITGDGSRAADIADEMVTAGVLRTDNTGRYYKIGATA